MAEPALKLAPEQKANPQAPTQAEAPAAQQRGLAAGFRRYRRPLLLIVLPTIAVIAGIAFYLSGGRYVTTDDAYVGAQKVLITPDISGKIDKVMIREASR